MGRKSLAGFVLFAFLIMAGTAAAAEKVENVFITGVDVGYFGYTGWMGDNFDAGLGFAAFFGYGITDNFAIELDWIPQIQSSYSGSDPYYKDAFEEAYWGGLAMEGDKFGGFGLSGKLYPRGRFRDADFVHLQPFLSMGMGLMPFIWTYKSGISQAAGETRPPYGTETFDGYNAFYLNLGGGLDYMFAKWVSLGLNAKIWKAYNMGDSLQGYGHDDDLETDLSGSMMWQVGLGLTFQW